MSTKYEKLKAQLEKELAWAKEEDAEMGDAYNRGWLACMESVMRTVNYFDKEEEA